MFLILKSDSKKKKKKKKKKKVLDIISCVLTVIAQRTLLEI